MTNNINEIKQWAAEYDRKLKSEAFIEKITLQHEDGTTLYCPNALVIYKGDYLIVFTEHLGYFIVHKDDVKLTTDYR